MCVCANLCVFISYSYNDSQDLLFAQHQSLHADLQVSSNPLTRMITFNIPWFFQALSSILLAHGNFVFACFWPHHPMNSNRTICYLGGCALRVFLWLVLTSRQPTIATYHLWFGWWNRSTRFQFEGNNFFCTSFVCRVSQFHISIPHFFCQRNVGLCYFQWSSVVHCCSPNHPNDLCAFRFEWRETLPENRGNPVIYVQTRQESTDISMVSSRFSWKGHVIEKTWNLYGTPMSVAPSEDFSFWTHRAWI